MSNYTVPFDVQFLETSYLLLPPKCDGPESKLIEEPPPSANKVVVGKPKNLLFQQQKSKQHNLTLLKDKLRLEILIKEKKLRNAQDLAFMKSGCNIKAGNVLIHEKSPLQLNNIAPETAIGHGASLTPDPGGGVLQAQILNDKLYSNETPILQIPTTLQANFQTQQIETEPNNSITHGASVSTGNVNVILQPQTHALSV